MTARANPRRVRVGETFDGYARSPDGAVFASRVLPGYRGAMLELLGDIAARWERLIVRGGYGEPSFDGRRELTYAKIISRSVRDVLALRFVGRVVEEHLFVVGNTASLDPTLGRASYPLGQLRDLFERYAVAYEAWIVALAGWLERPEVKGERVARAAARSAVFASESTRIDRGLLSSLGAAETLVQRPGVFPHDSAFGVVSRGRDIGDVQAWLARSLKLHGFGLVDFIVGYDDPTRVLPGYIRDPFSHTLANVEAMAAKAVAWAQHGEPFDARAIAAEEARIAAVDSDALVEQARQAYRAYVPPRPKRKR